jgi:hypothetical protein
MVVMLATAFFSWWYGQGWKAVFDSYGRRLRTVSETFSVRQLSRTLFAPWRRIITYPGASFADKVRAWGDNVFSRAIGFVVRCLVLFASLLAVLGAIIFTTIELVAWPLLPLLVPVCILAGLL